MSQQWDNANLLFLSTLPARGATRGGRRRAGRPAYFYPRSPRGERHFQHNTLNSVVRISIHAPREGSDAFFCLIFWDISDFYPRSPRGERPAQNHVGLAAEVISIHAPREGSDPSAGNSHLTTSHFYPRSPRGERPSQGQALRRRPGNFYPRSPRGERLEPDVYRRVGLISIHAPREGSDAGCTSSPIPVFYFYPRSPRGERRVPAKWCGRPDLFLSTLPARGATLFHVLSAGASEGYFYPRSPRGERHSYNG